MPIPISVLREQGAMASGRATSSESGKRIRRLRAYVGLSVVLRSVRQSHLTAITSRQTA